MKTMLKRGAGVLMPIFSLPSPYGIGTFGRAAYEFIDQLKRGRQTYWQVLPMGPTCYGVNELVPLSRQIVNNDKADIKQFLVGRERHTKHSPLLILIITHPFAFQVRNHLIKDYGSRDNRIRRIRIIL